MSVPEPVSTPASTTGERGRAGVGELLLRLIAALALAYDAYSHWDLAPTYDGIAGDISQGTLFRIEAVLAAVAAVAVLLVRRKIVWFGAFLVAAGGLAALLLYRYVNVGAIGPLPNMYEPAWYTEKAWSAISMAVASVALLILLLLPRRSSRHS